MFFTGTDMIEGDGAAATFHALIKSQGNGQVVAETYATSGMTAKRPYVMTYQYTTSGNGWFQPLAISASNKGLVGIASAAIASGCMGWVTVRGQVLNASSPATVQMNGSMGHAVYWAGASGLAASSSAYIGALHQIGFLIEEATATYAANIFLTGNQIAQSV